MTPYDAVPYASLPYFETHPDRLRLIGHLFGMTPPPVARARVLEIGCGSGGNLLPVAELHPESECLGIDLAATQIAAGHDDIRALGLRNVQLQAMDLAELGAGTFDYIICHGVYSWVPAATRARLLDVIGERLAPNGVALVSHNVKPGWYARAVAREMMLWHLGDRRSPEERVEQGRAFMQFIVSSARPEEERHRDQMQIELEHVMGTPDWVLLHDQLGEVNDACYFHEFAAELPGRGLQYLGDATVGSMFATGFRTTVQQAITALAADVLEYEQMLDFLRNRVFRMTVVCRAGVPLERELRPSLLRDLHLSAQLAVDDDGIFRTPRGHRAGPATAATRVALERLAAAWPRSIPAADLGADAETEAELFECLTANVVLAQLTPVRCAAPGDRPAATPLARLQAARGSHVTNLRHENVRLGPDARHVLDLLDGSRDRAALARATILGVEPLIDLLYAKGLLVA